VSGINRNGCPLSTGTGVRFRRITQPTPKVASISEGLAGDEEAMEVLERLDVIPPCRGRQAPGDEFADYTVDVVGACLPRGDLEQVQEAVQHARAVLDGDRAEAASRHDATNPSTHAAWNASALSSLASAAAAPVITRRPGFTMPTFFLPHEVKVAPNDRAHRLEDQG
jgi:hypothetical protein